IERAGEIGDPWGIPFSTGSDGDSIPSRQIAACRSLRKDLTHFTIGSGRCLSRSIRSSRVWLTKSKYPLMSNVMHEVTSPWLRAASIS
ncbi:hypothetical protein P692DRAFT_20735045, partial [Suillus brevipes Sb2]